VIRRVDETIVSLITTRYANISDYKEKIQRGIMLPSHIRSLLKENNLFPSSSVVDQAQLSTGTSKAKNSPKTYLPLKLSNLNNTNSGSVASPLLYSPFSVETTVPSNSQYDTNELDGFMDKLDLKKTTTSTLSNNSAVFFRKTPKVSY